ncbi:MAG TPA: tetratricopeptide repeat protein [Rhizomicrobium sp.]|nr:tetratricopeptide repeat protein [Rhizomicrobium sp.]
MAVMRICAVLALAAALFTPVQASPETDSAADTTNACVYGSGQKAIDACTHTIGLAKIVDPPDGGTLGAGVYADRGRVYAGMKMVGKAMDDFAQAIRLDPKNGHTYFMRGLAYLNDMDRYDLAVQDFTTALRLDPTYEEVVVDRGVAYLDLGQYERALQDFDAAMRLDPKDGVASADRGTAEDLLGRRDLAIPAYDEAIRRQPNLAWAYSQRCLSKLSMGQSPRAALADCNKALEVKQTAAFINAPRGALLAERALFFALTGNGDAARKDCASGGSDGEKGPQSSYRLYLCGLIETKAGDAARGNADMATAAANRVDPYYMRLYAGYSAPPIASAASGPGRLELALLADDPASATGAALHDAHDPNKTYFVARDITLPGDIEGMDAAVTAQGEPALELHLAAGAQKRIGDPSLMDHQIALVLDGRTVLAAATVRAPLSTDITLNGNFTTAEINELVAAIYPPSHADSFLAWMERTGVWYLAAALLLIALGVGVGRLLPRRA